MHKILRNQVPQYLKKLVSEKLYVRDTRMSRNGTQVDSINFRNKYLKIHLPYYKVIYNSMDRDYCSLETKKIQKHLKALLFREINMT